MDSNKSAIYLFLLLFTNAMVSCLVNESNRYAKQCLQAQGKDPDTWLAKLITIVEMKAWLGLLMVMSLHRLPATGKTTES